MRYLTYLCVFLLCGLLGACGQVPLNYRPTASNVETLRTANMAAVQVGAFALAPGKPASLDQSVLPRGTIVVSPINNSFALFLKDALTQELRAAGKLDPNAPIVISGLLTHTALDAPMGTGKGALAASFSVVRDGRRVFNKELEERAEWPSSFVGADAVPTAVNQFTDLYKKLIGQLLNDRDFKQATQHK
jgi:hypothetical protein